MCLGPKIEGVKVRTVDALSFFMMLDDHILYYCSDRETNKITRLLAYGLSHVPTFPPRDFIVFLSLPFVKRPVWCTAEGDFQNEKHD
jgi:hypothetical protein